MSCARPFKRSADPIKGLELWDCADELREQLPDDFIPIHKRIVNEYRDKVLAHSDTGVRDIKREDMKPVGVVITYRDPYPPPPLNEVEWLLEVIEPLREYADARRRELESGPEL